MHLNLDGSETAAELREAMRHLAVTKTRESNRSIRGALDAQIDELLDAEAAIKWNAV